jgi:hypothetical protein
MAKKKKTAKKKVVRKATAKPGTQILLDFVDAIKEQNRRDHAICEKGIGVIQRAAKQVAGLEMPPLKVKAGQLWRYEGDTYRIIYMEGDRELAAINTETNRVPMWDQRDIEDKFETAELLEDAP